MVKAINISRTNKTATTTITKIIIGDILCFGFDPAGAGVCPVGVTEVLGITGVVIAGAGSSLLVSGAAGTGVGAGISDSSAGGVGVGLVGGVESKVGTSGVVSGPFDVG